MIPLGFGGWPDPAKKPCPPPATVLTRLPCGKPPCHAFLSLADPTIEDLEKSPSSKTGGRSGDAISGQTTRTFRMPTEPAFGILCHSGQGVRWAPVQEPSRSLRSELGISTVSGAKPLGQPGSGVANRQSWVRNVQMRFELWLISKPASGR